MNHVLYLQYKIIIRVVWLFVNQFSLSSKCFSNFFLMYSILKRFSWTKLILSFSSWMFLLIVAILMFWWSIWSRFMLGAVWLDGLLEFLEEKYVNSFSKSSIFCCRILFNSTDLKFLQFKSWFWNFSAPTRIDHLQQNIAFEIDVESFIQSFQRFQFHLVEFLWFKAAHFLLLRVFVQTQIKIWNRLGL